MGGDGMGGLVVAIVVACIAMVALPAIVFVLVSHQLGRSKSVAVRLALASVAVFLGAVVGAAWVTATFFESTWSPPPRLLLQLPAGFKYASVIFLEQPSALRELSWTGRELPLMGKSAVVVVPVSGVIRLRSLGVLAGGGFQADVTQNMRVTTMAIGPVANDADAKYYVYVGFEKFDAEQSSASGAVSGESLPVDPAVFSAYVKAREKGRITTP